MSTKELDAWMKRQIRLAGEELIRRSETTSMEGWDGVQNIFIEIDIPTYTDRLEVPSITISVETLNKVALLHLMTEGHDESLLVTKEGNPVVTDNT